MLNATTSGNSTMMTKDFDAGLSMLQKFGILAMLVLVCFGLAFFVDKYSQNRGDTEGASQKVALIQPPDKAGEAV